MSNEWTAEKPTLADRLTSVLGPSAEALVTALFLPVS
jgi:hypothetical protein